MVMVIIYNQSQVRDHFNDFVLWFVSYILNFHIYTTSDKCPWFGLICSQNFWISNWPYTATIIWKPRWCLLSLSIVQCFPGLFHIIHYNSCFFFQNSMTSFISQALWKLRKHLVSIPLIFIRHHNYPGLHQKKMYCEQCSLVQHWTYLWVNFRQNICQVL